MGGGSEHVLVKQPLSSQFLELPEGVSSALPGSIHRGICYPKGFVAGATACGLKASGRGDLGVCVVAPEWRGKAASSVVTTRNSFAAAPILLTRDGSARHLVGVAMNSGNANACTGDEGRRIAKSMRAEFAQFLGVPDAQAGIASTGIIGRIPNEGFLLQGIRDACSVMSREGEGAFAESILTTDRFPKSWGVDVDLGGETVRIGGVAKGAGMIRPEMATMLAVITTDADISPEQADVLVAKAVAATFNRITVDGQMSTNDCLFLLSSGASGVTVSEAMMTRLGFGIEAVCKRLALMMLADGEGARRIARISVEGAAEENDAEVAARAIADSPLVKTAIWGGDPNWGRVLSAAGAALPDRSFPQVALAMAGVQVVEDGTASHLTVSETESLTQVMAGDEIDIRLDLGVGDSAAEVFFSDMGYEYVRINAEYHT